MTQPYHYDWDAVDPVVNIFCPTGPGGGINPTCGRGGTAVPSSPATASSSPSPARGRQLAPASPEGAQKRFQDVTKAVFGGKAKLTEEGDLVYSMPGGRFISVKLQAKVVARHGSHVVLRYDARVDFGVEGRAPTSVAPKLERESVALLRKVKEAVKEYHKAGFSLEVQPSDARRREAYAKILADMGLKIQQTGEVEVWNERLRQAVENIFCPTGPGGGIDPTCGAGKGTGGGKTPLSPAVASALSAHVTDSGRTTDEQKQVLAHAAQRSNTEAPALHRVFSEDPKWRQGEVVVLGPTSFTAKDITTGESAGQIGWKSRDEALAVVERPKRGLDVDYTTMGSQSGGAYSQEREVVTAGAYRVKEVRRVTEPGTPEQYGYKVPQYVLEEL